MLIDEPTLPPSRITEEDKVKHNRNDTDYIEKEHTKDDKLRPEVINTNLIVGRSHAPMTYQHTPKYLIEKQKVQISQF